MKQLDFESIGFWMKGKKWLFITLVLIAAFVGVYYLGKTQGREQADSEYLQERDKRMAQIAVFEAKAKEHAEREQQLDAENAILKKQNEAVAEVLKSNDAKLKGDAAKFGELLVERNRKIETINANDNYQEQVCGLCADARASGFPLSAKFCEKCEVK